MQSPGNLEKKVNGPQPGKFLCRTEEFSTKLLRKSMLNLRLIPNIKAGVHMKAVFWLGIMVLMQISRSRFKRTVKNLSAYLMEIGSFEDLVLL